MKAVVSLTSLKAKFLIPTTILLVISFLGLALSIIGTQKGLLVEMGERVNQSLQTSNHEIQNAFERMDAEVVATLNRMGETTTKQLSASTEDTLSAERQRINGIWLEALRSNANSTAELLAQVAPSAILSYNFTSLISYVKAATRNPDIVFAFYLKPDGKPLTRYFDRKNPKIVEYLENGNQRQKHQRVISGASNDESVVLVEKTIAFEGKDLGKVLLCVSKMAVQDQINQMESRFSEIIQNNATKVNAVLGGEIETVRSQIQKHLADVGVRNARAAEKVIGDIDQSRGRVQTKTANIVSMGGAICGIIILVSVGFLAVALVIRPITQVADRLKDIAQGEGDLTIRLEETRQDEVGRLAKWFNVFIDKLEKIIQRIADNSNDVNIASNELFSIAQQMSDGTNDLSARSNTVATAAEEMSANMNSVAAAMEQAATNVNVVASATEEMTVNVNEVAVNSGKAKQATRDAVAQTNHTTEKVVQLGSAAQKIGKITEVITEISEQTNLLALNATIEAARAGEAGKGFAVVANEIKELARQTADATQEIRTQIEDVQRSTDDTVTDIRKITKIISGLDDMVASVSASVNEQSTATTEISDNLAQASKGIQEVTLNVAQSSSVAEEIAREIVQVNQISSGIADSSGQVNKSSGSLSDSAAELKKMIGEFKVSNTVMTGIARKDADIGPLMKWNNSLAVEIDEIDQQHQKLIGLINDLHLNMKRREGNQTIGNILKDLVDYTVYHFGAEEKLMQEHGYEGYDNHKSIHKKLIKRVVDFQTKFNAGGTSVDSELMSFLKNWLIKHIQGTDKQYAPFFHSKGVH